MAPYPEEVDVFTVPHSRMKELIDNYCDMLSQTNFSNGHEFGNLLQNLHNTFSEFKSHEQIENRYIMAQLRRKLDALSIENQAVCNCHKDNRLTEMMNMFRDGYRWMDKSMRERVNYEIKLKEAVADFTKDFVPHMKEEEEVFQPLLMKYFSYEELQDLRKKVIREHYRNLNEEKYICDEKEATNKSEKTDEKEDCQEKVTSVLDLPPEITMKIFSHLNPKELSRCAQVCRSWSDVAMDGKLWQEVSPVRWAQGDWHHGDEEDSEGDENDDDGGYDEEDENEYICLDEDRDIDESESSDECSDNENENLLLIKRESKILHSLVKYTLPRVGWGVKKLNLANSKALTNGLLFKMLSHCPNLDHLILTQTTVSDSAFKGLIKHGTCGKLKSLILSGCANITDVTLIRFAKALKQNNTLESKGVQDGVEKADEVSSSVRKKIWTNSEREGENTKSGSDDFSDDVAEVSDDSGIDAKTCADPNEVNCSELSCTSITNVACRQNPDSVKQNYTMGNVGEVENIQEDVDEDESVHNGQKEFWTKLEQELEDDESVCGDSDVVMERMCDDDTLVDKPSADEDTNCCEFGCGCRIGLNLGIRLNASDVNLTKYSGDTVPAAGEVRSDVAVLRKVASEPLFGNDAEGNGENGPKSSYLELDSPDPDSKPPDWPLVDLEECADGFFRQADGALRRASNCNDPRCVKFVNKNEETNGEKWMKIIMEDEFAENVPLAVSGDRDKGPPGPGDLEVESVEVGHLEASEGSSVDENGNGPGVLFPPCFNVLGGRPPDNCDGMRGANEKDSARGKSVMCPKDGSMCEEEDWGGDDGREVPVQASSGRSPVAGICCKVLDELQASKSPTAPSGGHGEVQESVAARRQEPGAQLTSLIRNTNHPSDAQSDIRAGAHRLKPERLFSDENLKRTFDRDPFYMDLGYVSETSMAWTPRLLEHLNLSGCFRITDAGLRSLTEDGGLPDLRSLDLSGCSNISAAGLTDLVQGCPKLDHEKFFYCDNIVNGPLASLANGCQNVACSRRVCCRSAFYLYN